MNVIPFNQPLDSRYIKDISKLEIYFQPGGGESTTWLSLGILPSETSKWL